MQSSHDINIIVAGTYYFFCVKMLTRKVEELYVSSSERAKGTPYQKNIFVMNFFK